MSLDATLERLVLSTPQPIATASFYERTFGYALEAQGNAVACEAPGRSVWWQPGPPNQLVFSQFRLRDANALQRYAEALETRGVSFAWLQDRSELQTMDPEGRRIRFTATSSPRVVEVGPLSARLQHYAVRSPSPAALLAFYAGDLGFAVSDTVHDEDGNLRAAFLRTDTEHHALAIFTAPVSCFDHFSCETGDWLALRNWADHMAAVDVPMAWGIGRHGPGNDTFFMVKDPDGNLAEISSDLEVCAPDRPAGRWPHRPQTLNVWGMAIMRS